MIFQLIVRIVYDLYEMSSLIFSEKYILPVVYLNVFEYLLTFGKLNSKDNFFSYNFKKIRFDISCELSFEEAVRPIKSGEM